MPAGAFRRGGHHRVHGLSELLGGPQRLTGACLDDPAGDAVSELLLAVGSDDVPQLVFASLGEQLSGARIIGVCRCVHAHVEGAS